MSSDSETFTELLQRHRGGDDTPLGALLPTVYDELRSMARQKLQGESAQGIEPTALVHEVYLRLVDQRLASVEDRAHFRRLCGRVMRQVLVDQARRRNAQKRDGNREETLVTAFEPVGDMAQSGLSVLALDEALERLVLLDARKAQVVELRSFGGLSMDEVAEVLAVSLRTVEADWFFARAWLKAELSLE